MKFRKLIALICVLALSVGASYAIQNKNKTEQKTEYVNEIHSVFSLNDCIKIAIDNNPDIRAAVYNEESYKSKIGQAWAAYFPSLNVGIDVSRSENKYTHEKKLPYGYRSMSNTMSYIPNVSADMLLFDFGKTKAVADMAKSMYEASKEDTKENINNIVRDIKVTYYNILFAQAQVKVYEDTVNDFKLQRDQAFSFYKVGTRAKIDYVTAEYNLGKAQLNLVKAKNVLEVAQVQLSKIMGIPEYTNYELSDKLTLNKYEINEKDAVKTAMDVRPELLAAEQNVNAAKMSLRAARRGFTPDLGIYGSYGNGIGNNYNMRSAQVGLGLNYKGFNLLESKKQVDEVKAEYKKSRAQLESVKDSVYLNVKKTYIDLQTDMKAIVIAKLALDQAIEQYKQATGRYEAGVGDAIELKDGENTYLNARLDFYNAILNYNVSAANLEKEIGVPIEISQEKVLNIESEDL